MPKPNHYFYNAEKVRFNLISTQGNKPFNWLFFPGGPGIDSAYFLKLMEVLTLPGNVWLIDFPGNGSHAIPYEDFDNWLDIFVPCIRQFDNPIIVGHSAGGMYPLLYPELEDLLSGLVLLNSAPCLWQEAAAKRAKELQLPDISKEMKIFTEHPGQETFHIALSACMPYYFTKESLAAGREQILSIPFNFAPAVWFQKKMFEIHYQAKWIPKHVPTLIITAEFDSMCPAELFMKDERFNRANIQRHYLKNAGHFPWIEQPKAVKAVFDGFLSHMLNGKT